MRYYLIAFCALLLAYGCVKKTNEWHVTDSDIYVEGTGVEVNKGDDKLSSDPNVDATLEIPLVKCNGCHDISGNITLAGGNWLGEISQDDIDDIFNKPKPKPEKPKPAPPKPKPAPPKPKPAPKYSKKYHHYNPDSAMGGPALILCPDSPRYKSCSINGLPMMRHGSQDKGRDLWTIYNKHRGIGGEITCKYKDEVTIFNVKGGSGMDWGSCK